MDQPLWKVNSWKVCRQGSHLLPMGVQNDLPGWMHGAVGKRAAEQHCRLQLAMVKVTAVGMRSPHNSCMPPERVYDQFSSVSCPSLPTPP